VLDLGLDFGVCVGWNLRSSEGVWGSEFLVWEGHFLGFRGCGIWSGRVIF